MSAQAKGVIEVQPAPKNANDSVSLQLNFDVIEAVILLISASTLAFGWLLNKKIELTKKRDIQSRIRKQDFLKEHEIEAIMNRMLAVSGASRVSVALFSNGEHIIFFPFRYFSIFWEVVDTGVSETIHEHQRKPLNKIKDDLMLYMNEPNVFTKTSIQDPNLKEECRKYMLKFGVRLILGRLLGDAEHGYIGVMNIHFEENSDISQDTITKLDSLFLLLEHKIENGQKNYST